MQDVQCVERGVLPGADGGRALEAGGFFRRLGGAGLADDAVGVDEPHAEFLGHRRRGQDQGKPADDQVLQALVRRLGLGGPVDLGHLQVLGHQHRAGGQRTHRHQGRGEDLHRDRQPDRHGDPGGMQQGEQRARLGCQKGGRRSGGDQSEGEIGGPLAPAGQFQHIGIGQVRIGFQREPREQEGRDEQHHPRVAGKVRQVTRGDRRSACPDRAAHAFAL